MNDEPNESPALNAFLNRGGFGEPTLDFSSSDFVSFRYDFFPTSDTCAFSLRLVLSHLAFLRQSRKNAFFFFCLERFLLLGFYTFLIFLVELGSSFGGRLKTEKKPIALFLFSRAASKRERASDLVRWEKERKGLYVSFGEGEERGRARRNESRRRLFRSLIPSW